jgi:hypothetical protein
VQFLVYGRPYARFITRFIALLRDFERAKCQKRVYGPMPVLFSLLPYGTEVPGYLRCPFHFLAASLRRFMAIQCEQSEAHEREKRERNPCREPMTFYASDNNPLRSSRRSRDAGFPIIYPNLRVRLKKVHGFYKGFLRFSSIFSVFPRFPH